MDFCSPQSGFNLDNKIKTLTESPVNDYTWAEKNIYKEESVELTWVKSC